MNYSSFIWNWVEFLLFDSKLSCIYAPWFEIWVYFTSLMSNLGNFCFWVEIEVNSSFLIKKEGEFKLCDLNFNIPSVQFMGFSCLLLSFLSLWNLLVGYIKIILKWNKVRPFQRMSFFVVYSESWTTKQVCGVLLIA